MARRRLVSDAAWAELMALATEERDLMRHYVLSADDLAVLRTKRSPAKRLCSAPCVIPGELWLKMGDGA